MTHYGAAPQLFARFEPAWHEFMHYLYLPVMIPGHGGIRMPENLSFLRPMVHSIAQFEGIELGAPNRYVYVTARRGFATAGVAALNRPGWHADGFGSTDINYIWSDDYPTLFAVGDFGPIADDHIESVAQFSAAIGKGKLDAGVIDVRPGERNAVYRLDPSVVHATATVPEPGGERSFFKVSVSDSKYNMLGNSRNHAFDYHWRMFARSELRNDPAFAGGDHGPQEG